MVLRQDHRRGPRALRPNLGDPAFNCSPMPDMLSVEHLLALQTSAVGGLIPWGIQHPSGASQRSGGLAVPPCPRPPAGGIPFGSLPKVWVGGAGHSTRDASFCDWGLRLRGQWPSASADLSVLLARHLHLSRQPRFHAPPAAAGDCRFESCRGHRPPLLPPPHTCHLLSPHGPRLGVPSPLTLPTGAASRGRTQSMHHYVPQLSSPRHQPMASRYTPHFTLAQYSTARRRHT